MNRFFLTAICLALLIFSGAFCFSKATEKPINAVMPAAEQTAASLPETMSDDMQNMVTAGLNA